MDALELALRCSSILMRSLAGSKDDDSRDPTSLDTSSLMGVEEEGENDRYLNAPLRLNNSDMNESDCEKHFKGVCKYQNLYCCTLNLEEQNKWCPAEV